MSRTNLTGLTLALALAAAGAAEAKQWKYAGLHPRTGQPAGGLCHIHAVHVHAASPVHADVLYRLHDGVYVFIGDPTPFGYEGPRHAYYGHHPVVLEVVLEEDAPEDDVEYCYHDGPHYHAYAPPPRQEFVEKEEVHYYAGEYPAEYTRERPKLVRVNTVYTTWRTPRPVVTVAPPPEYHGPIFSVNVALPVPAIEVNLGTVVPVRHDVVIVEDEHHVHTKHKKHKHKKHKGWKD